MFALACVASGIRDVYTFPSVVSMAKSEKETEPVVGRS